MNPLVEQGIKAFQSGRYAEAIAFYEQALAELSDDARLHVLLASAYHYNGQLNLARTHYEFGLAQSDSEQLLAAAQTGLSKVAQGIIPRRTVTASLDTQRLPSRPREGLIACPQCGETLVKEACICGFLPRDPRRLGLDLVQAFCGQAGVIVFARVGLDTYLIDWDRVCYRTANEQMATVDPRLVFPPLHGVPMVRADSLLPISPFQQPWVVYPRPGKPGEPRPYKWEAFCEEVAERLGVEFPVALAPFEASSLFASYRIFPPGEIGRLKDEAVRLGMSFGQAVHRVTGMPIDTLLRDMRGEGSHFKPSNRMANSLGWDLMADGLLTPEELQEAITRQVEYPKPLIQLILSSTPLSPEEVEPVAEAARLRQAPRAIRDRLGELLVRHGAVSRAQLQDALEQQARMPFTQLGEILRGMGVSAAAIDEVLRYQRIKDQLRYGGQARLGEILVKRGVVSRQQLLEALLAQIDQPLPLGEILVRRGMASPEQVFLALDQQEMTLDALVESERDMERQDQGGSGQVLTLSIDLEREKQRLHQLWGGLKAGFKASMKEVKTAIEAVREQEAQQRSAGRTDGEPHDA